MAVLHRHRHPGFWLPKIKPPPGDYVFAPQRVAAKTVLPLLAPGAAQDVSRGRLMPITGTPIWTPTARGLGLAYSSGCFGALADYPPPPTTFTVEVLFIVGTVQAEPIIGYSDSTMGVYDRQIFLTAAGKVTSYFAGGSDPVGTSTFASGDVVHAVVVMRAGFYGLYINGVLEASTASPGGYNGYSSTDCFLRIGNQKAGGGGAPVVSPTHTLLLAAVWSDAMTTAEVTQRCAEPWSIVGPTGLRIRVTSGAPPPYVRRPYRSGRLWQRRK